jgi:hypothetical protein
MNASVNLGLCELEREHSGFPVEFLGDSSLPFVYLVLWDLEHSGFLVEFLGDLW